MEPMCGNCRHWLSADTAIGECRRRAPLPVLKSHLPASAGAAGREAEWPITIRVDYCGDFQAESVGPTVEVREIDDGRAA